jgi:hypothetical protein
MNYMTQIQNMEIINYLTAQMESMVGLPGCLPRFNIPKPPAVIQQKGSITLNNINIEKSVIGAINTGNIGQIDVALSNIKNGGNEELFSVFKEFTEAVLQAKELDDKMKNEIIEQLVVLSSQAALPEEGRKQSIIRMILASIGDYTQHISGLVALLKQLKDFFGF